MPQTNVLLQIQKAENQDLSTKIKIGLDDMNTFILLLNEKLKGSNMKLVLQQGLIEHDLKLKCCDFINNAFSPETFKNPTTFENWWENRSTHFGRETRKIINANFIDNFVARITDNMTSTSLKRKLKT